MAFVPPHFSKFGSSADDLIKKKLEDDGKHSLIVNAQSKNIKATHTINTVKKGEGSTLEAKLALKYEDKQWGESTLELATSGKVSQDVRLTKLAPNTTVTTRFDTDSKFGSFGASPAFQYRQEFFAGSLEYNYAKKNAIVGLVGGYEGFSGGAQVTANTTKLMGEKKDEALTCNFGLQYEDRNVTAAAGVDSENSVNLSLFHNMNKDTQLAGKVIVTVNNSSSVVGAVQHVLSPNTLLKGKVHIVNDYQYAIAGHVQQKLASPDLTLGVTAFIDSKKPAPVFGISATFDA